MHTVQQILHPQHPFIKNRAENAKNNTEDQIKPQRIKRRIRKFTDVNQRNFMIKNPVHNGRHNDANKYRFYRN
ncbi:Uncharacterised protein [Shigella sonnei]|nr:Uncharacterised protein [Shigella sonnei]